jgi:hypothetical protein
MLLRQIIDYTCLTGLAACQIVSKRFKSFHFSLDGAAQQALAGFVLLGNATSFRRTREFV